MRSRALRVRDVTKLMGLVNFGKRPWMTSGQLAALFPISVGAYQPGSTVGLWVLLSTFFLVKELIKNCD